MKNMNNTNNLLEKAYTHFYSMRAATYMPKKNTIEVYLNVIRVYCSDRGLSITDNEIRAFLENRIPKNPKYDNDAA